MQNGEPLCALVGHGFRADILYFRHLRPLLRPVFKGFNLEHIPFSFNQYAPIGQIFDQAAKAKRLRTFLRAFAEIHSLYLAGDQYTNTNRAFHGLKIRIRTEDAQQ